jgi:tRNA(Ile)-lysidine synthase
MSRALPLERRLAESWPPPQWQDVTVLVAVSGGADSVALLRSLQAIKSGGDGSLAVAHFNHGLRGEASDEDARFVQQLSKRLGCHVGCPADMTTASEEAARDARYEFLQRTAEQIGARYLVTAHTADDQAETVLHRIVRGTGLAGLSGMPRVRRLSEAVTLIRPLLEFDRQCLREYLTSLEQSFREDATNRDVAFTRNRIRHELLPQLAKDYNPAVRDALLRLAGLAGESQEVIRAAVDELRSRCMIACEPGQMLFDCLPLRESLPHVVRETLLICWREQQWPLQSMGYSEWDALAALVTGDDATRKFPGDVCAKKQGEQLSLTRPVER